MKEIDVVWRDAVLDECERMVRNIASDETVQQFSAEQACDYAADRIRAMKAAPAPAADALAVRKAALEEAARHLDARASVFMRDAAAAIRALADAPGGDDE